MKINVTRIPKEGLDLDFSEKDGWLQEKLNRSLKEKHHKDDKISGHFRIEESMDNIQVDAKMHLPIHANCDRCLKNLDFEIDVKAYRILAPLFESKRQKEIEKKMDVEVTEEDFQFSYYKGEEIDVGDIIVEQVVLDQPMIYLCKKDCKGLCPRCATNLNEKTCKCAELKIQESPFAALKDFGKKKPSSRT